MSLDYSNFTFLQIKITNLYHKIKGKCAQNYKKKKTLNNCNSINCGSNLTEFFISISIEGVPLFWHHNKITNRHWFLILQNDMKFLPKDHHKAPKWHLCFWEEVPTELSSKQFTKVTLVCNNQQYLISNKTYNSLFYLHTFIRSSSCCKNRQKSQ